LHTDDSDQVNQSSETTTHPAVGPIRLITFHTSDELKRRSFPRRKMAAAFAIERRRGDRRRAKPGIDGLLRTVLAGDWI
jgi:hypothetical protein